VAVAVAGAPGRWGVALATFAAFVTSALALRRAARAAAHLPVLRVAFPAVVAAVAVAATAAIALATDLRGPAPAGWLLVFVVGAAVSILAERGRQRARRPRSVRVAFVGGPEAALRLAGDLGHHRRAHARLVGRIAAEAGDGDAVPVLGALGGLRATLIAARVDLLVLGSGVARLELFDELAETCLDLPVHLVELSAFYEDVFGHVATAEINAAWFVHLVDPRAHRPSPGVKRAVDLALALVLGLIALPLLAVLVVLVRLDGGPAVFAQTRIGERGRPFRLFKLRTMRVGSGDEAAWAEENDPRATLVGRFLRRSHLDELPQLWNVLRAEMSFVGPRPEQIPFVERLERSLPFYQRRHLIRPGLTGWAQVRCGYAGSDVGAAWKLCNDLYYVKHRSLGLDLLLLVETAGLLLFGSTAVEGAQLVPWAGTGLPSEAGPSGLPPAPPPTVPPVAEMPVLAVVPPAEGDQRATG
jgi:exopolysaccharide biosynthesis polyprenyl glycosylphosphotransferase